MFTFPVSSVGRVSPVFDGVIFAGGTNGAIVRSRDGGGSWEDVPLSTGFDGTLSGVIIYGSTIVSYGVHGFLQYSSDGGDSWTESSIAYDDEISSVVWDNINSVWIASIRDSIYNTSDLVSWTYRSKPEAFSNINSLAYGNSIVVAVGSNAMVYTSSNGGVSWVERSISGLVGSEELLSVSYLNSYFLITGSSGVVATSTDGVTWTKRVTGTTESLYSATYHGSTWYVVGSNQQIIKSTDLSAWTHATAGSGQISSSIFSKIRSDGTSMIICSSNSDDYQTSTDGVTWTKRDVSISGVVFNTNEVGYFKDAVWDSSTSRWIIVGNITNTASGFDSAHWKVVCGYTSDITSSITSLAPSGNSHRTYRSFVYNPYTSVWYVVADGTNTIIYTEDEGDTWTVVDLVEVAPTVFNGDRPIGGLWYAYENYIMTEVGSDVIYSTPDPLNLSLLASSITTHDLSTTGSGFPYRAGDFIQGQWMLLLKGGIIAKSFDGVTWSTTSIPTSGQDIYQIKFGNGVYVAVGYDGKIFTSTDTNTWTARTTPNSTTSSFVHLYFNGGWFFAYTVSGYVYRSQDGITWVLVKNYGTGYFDASSEHVFLNGVSNTTSIGIMPSSSALRKTHDHTNFKSVSTGTSALSPQWRSSGCVPYPSGAGTWVWSDGWYWSDTEELF